MDSYAVCRSLSDESESPQNAEVATVGKPPAGDLATRRGGKPQL